MGNCLHRSGQMYRRGVSHVLRTLIKGQRRNVDDYGQPGHCAKDKHDGAQDPHPSVEASGQVLELDDELI